MSIIDTLISLCVPHECLGCNAEGTLLCADCTEVLPKAQPQCYLCLKPSARGVTCCDSSLLLSTQSALLYQGLTKDLLWGLKSGGMQAAVKPMARLLCSAIPQSAVIVPIPTATGRVRRRGYDQSVLLARELSRQTGVPCLKLLRRHGQAHQVGADRQARKHQLINAYQSKPAQELHVVLVDDVMTTGATLEAAAQALQAAGAAGIDAVTFARA